MFESFDPTPYQRAPRLDALGLLALGRALVETKPSEASDAIERAAEKLEHVLDEPDETVDARRRESSPVDFSAEMVLDGGADALWAVAYLLQYRPLRGAANDDAALGIAAGPAWCTVSLRR
jgi:hypothetical protein